MNSHFRKRIESLAASFARRDAAFVLPGVAGAAPAYLLARLLEHVPPGPLLVIAPDPEGAEEFLQELTVFSGGEPGFFLFPPWDTTPFEEASPLPEVTGRRLTTLVALQEGRARVVVTSPSACCQRVIPRTVLGDVARCLTPGEEVDREELLAALVRLGYGSVPLVEDRGTFAVRGGIVDIFPPDRELPVRVEFFGDQVETLRAFDPASQRSLRPVEALVLLPSREIILTDEVLEGFAQRAKALSDRLELPPDRRRQLLEQLRSAIFPPGIDYLQPLFHPGLESLVDYLGPERGTVLLDPDRISDALASFLRECREGEERATARDRLVPPATELFLDDGGMRQLLQAHPRLEFPFLEVAALGGEVVRFAVTDNRDLRVDVAKEEPEGVLLPLVERLRQLLAAGDDIVMACHTAGQAQRLHDLLARHGLPLAVSETPFPDLHRQGAGRIAILVGQLSRGFRLADEGLAVIAEEEVFGRRIKRRGVTEARRKQILSSLAELKPGDHMVHVDFGVGIYRGLEHLKLEGLEGDFLLLEYAAGDRLYLPMDRLNLVQRYVGAEGLEPRVDRLGGSSWEKSTAKARAAVHEMAEELLRIYAARQIQQGLAFSPPDDYFREFEAAFAWEETPDQMAAIEDVLADMQADRPMDRLVCGDVGYGKTEVAMRGAFKAVMDGKQVAVLVPTTVLAQQHLETFRRRFDGYPVNVEMLSRFRSPKEQKVILARVASGEVDIIIGTHRLLQQDVHFKALGLLIVDEEQRFGVAHKERLKKFRAVVDILTLTATPIPRTLYMSLMGIRDLSLIDTPPVDRLAIKTFVARFADDLIREAVLRELRRGGQIFFVHNRVQTIGAMAEHLRRIVPEARIAVGHGQMEERELEQVMLSFMHGESDLLLCTTIIESGLDIPRANTLIVNRADTFGLSQLYQLRGRVGRSSQRAFAYFMIPGEGSISQDARERLKILQEITELGAGFRIATHDLELRGAGDLLGAKQAGQIAAVGFELFTEMLEEAIAALKGEEPELRLEPEIKLRVPAFIPEGYVPAQNQRLILYKKLAQAHHEGEIEEVRGELLDRFGPLPQAVVYLLEVMTIRLELKRLLVQEAEFDGKRIVLSFHEKTPVSPETVMALLAEAPSRRRFTPDYKLAVELDDTTFEGVIAGARNLLKRLG
jgi:transcription-repair coupling factor (superfamily II helicase)